MFFLYIRITIFYVRVTTLKRRIVFKRALSNYDIIIEINKTMDWMIKKVIIDFH